MDNKDKQALINGTATIPYKIHVLNDDGNIKDTLTEEDIVSTDYEDYRYVDSSSLCIGQFVARKLKGEVKVIDKDLQIEDNEISVEMGVNRNDGSKEYALSIDGKSEQDGTPTPEAPVEIKTVKGIENLIEPKMETTTLNGITCTNNGDGTFTINGTNTSSSTTSFRINQSTYNGTDNLKTYNGLYTFSCKELVSGLFMNIMQNGTWKSFCTISDTNNISNKTFNNDDNLFIYIGVSGGKTINNVTIRPMFEKGKIAHEYVPYGSWLQVKNTGKNLYNSGNITTVSNGTNNNGVITSNTFSSNYFNLEPYNTIDLEAGTYYFSTDIRIISGTPTINKINDSISDATVVSKPTLSTTKQRYVYKKTYTSATQLTIMLFQFNASADSVVEISNIMISKEDTEYEPYKETSTLIDMNKSNLFDKDNANIFHLYPGKTFASNNNYNSICIEIKPNTTYTLISSNHYSDGLAIGTSEEYPISGGTVTNTTSVAKTKNNVTITSGENDKYLLAYIKWSGTLTEEILNGIKIYEGVGTDDYYELSSIGDTKDILTIQNGQAYINQKIGKVVLDGSEGWSKINNAFQTTDVFPTSIRSIGASLNAYCSHFKYKYYASGITSQIQNEEFGWNSGKRFTIRNDNVSTAAEFKTWLKEQYDNGTPVEVYYELAEPQTISLGKYNRIESIDDTENITIQTNIDTTFTKISYDLINWYNLGNFLITKPTDDDVKDTLTFDSMDYTKKFNKYFDSSGISFPCTALQLAKYCCEECGVELATTEFLNYDFEVIDNQYTNEDTFRNVMQDIGKLAYSWIRIGWDNKCYIDFNYGKEVDEYNKIDNDNYYDLEVQQKVFGPVNRVIIGMSDVEGENVYIEDEESISKYGVTEIKIYDNNLTYTPELRNQAITNAKCLFGLTYTPMTLNTTGHPWLLGNEKCEVTYMDGTKQYTYPWDRTITYSGHIKTKLESKCDTKTETEYKYKGDVETLLNKTRIIVNKQEGTITSLTQTTETIQDNLQQNYYDRTQTNQLIQTSGEGITNTFSEAGGNNVLRNTGLWFKESTKSTLNYIYPSETLYPSENTFAVEQANWEYWAGFALKVSNDRATLNTAIRLQKGDFIQEQDVPNGNYSISFMYKKLIKLADVRVTINDKEYILDSEDWTQFYTGKQDSNGNYITFPIEITSRHITIKFSSDTNNSLELYDLMCNKGTVKLAYSQNENEVTTDTVNISKGITITSSTTETKFKADSDGIRIKNKNNDEVITEFTDKGMTTKEVIVENEATIVKLLIQDIDDQTWFTRL